MSAAASARLLVVGTTWRLTGITAAGDALVTAVTAGGESDRMLAGMLLVRAGDRSVRVVAEAILAGRAATDLVDVLASIDTDQSRAALVRVSQAPQAVVAPGVTDAAAAALRTLDEIRRRDDGRS